MLEPVTPQGINTMIRRLKNNGSAGLNDIKMLPLELISYIISPVLFHIINEMLLTEISLVNLKTANVNSIHKSDDRKNLQNYRPTSVLPVVSKVFEGATGANQSLTDIEDEIIENIEGSFYTLCSFFIYFQKPYDTV